MSPYRTAPPPPPPRAPYVRRFWADEVAPTVIGVFLGNAIGWVICWALTRLWPR